MKSSPDNALRYLWSILASAIIWPTLVCPYLHTYVIVKWSLSQISNLILIYYLTDWRRGALMATRHCSPVSLEHFSPSQGGNGVVGSIMIFLDVFIVICWIANNWTSVFWTDLGFSCCTRNGRQSYIWGHWSWKWKITDMSSNQKGQIVRRRLH